MDSINPEIREQGEKDYIADLAKKHGEDRVVVNAIESHHGDKKSEYVISELGNFS